MSGYASAEGLVCKFTGPGTVYIQTRNAVSSFPFPPTPWSESRFQSMTIPFPLILAPFLTTFSGVFVASFRRLDDGPKLQGGVILHPLSLASAPNRARGL